MSRLPPCPTRLLALALVALLLGPGLLALAQAPTGTYEAEAFPTKTTGGRATSSLASGGAYWNIWSNGYVQTSVSFAGAASAELQVRARGTPLGGQQAHMVVSLDGASVIDATVTGTFTWYGSGARSIAAGAHTVRISFTNDALSRTEDRNLHADALRFVSTAPPPPPPPPGPSKEAESFATKTAGGRQASSTASGGAYWNLWSNGDIEDTLPGDGATPLTVVAAGTPLGGVWPQMVVQVDGSTTATFTVATKAWASFQAPPLPSGDHRVRIRFTNDALSSTEDRNLLLDVVRSAAGSGGGSGGGSGAGFTLPDGGSADAAATGGGYLVAHAATPLADDTGPALEVDVDGSPAQVAPVTGPVPRPVVAALPNGTHNVTFRAHGGTVLVQDWAVQAALPPADVTGAAARVHSGGSAEGSGWRFTDFGSLETDLVVPDSGWYLLRVQGVASVGSVGPLVHLWLNRTVVAEGTQGATVDLAQPVYLQGLVGATMGASFENPTGGSTVRIDRVSATPTDAPPPPGPAMSLGANTDPDGWPQYGRDAWNTRSNPDPALPDAARAGRLGLQWRTQLDGSVTGTPAVAGGTVFVGTWGKSLYALDEADGSVRWRAALPDRMDDSPAVAQGVVLGGAGASLLAFDAANGTQLWRHDFTGHLWASPVVDGSDVFIGVDSDRGYVAKLDVATGAVAWQVATTDVPNTGARVWATPLVPPGSGLVVVGTSPGNDNGQPATMDSLLALDRDSGSVVWAHRLFPGVDTNNDSAPAALAQNRDISGTPHLALLDGRPVVLASEKHGPAWALDLATGQLVHGSRMPTPRTTLLGSGGTAQGVEVVSGTEPDRVAAFDLATGDLRWEQALPTTDFAPVAIGQGVVWIGAWDGKLRAFDLASGHALAAYDAGGGVMGGAALAHGAVFVGALQMPSSGSFNDSLGKLPGYMSKWS